MSDISVQLRESSPELDGGPSFNAFLRQGILDGVVGDTNLGRILEFGIADMLDVETRIYLEVAMNKETYNGRKFSQHNIGEFILPIVRVAADFEPKEEVLVRPSLKNATWETREVFATESETGSADSFAEDLDPGEIDLRGKILIGTDTSFEYRIRPNWPGLIPIKLAQLFRQEHRLQNKKIDDIRISAIAGFFFRASFFDKDFTSDERFTDQCYAGLRYYDLGVPKRPIK